MVKIRFPEPNSILQGRYRITALIHHRENSTVYGARDLHTPHYPPVHRLVVVEQFPNPESLPSKQMPFIIAFQHEVNKLARITPDHRMLPKIFDFFDEHGDVFLVTKYLHGSDLEFLLRNTKVELPVKKVIEWAIETCDALDYLHSQPKPYVFRDLKPSHIIINSFGKIQLIDFALLQ